MRNKRRYVFLSVATVRWPDSGFLFNRFHCQNKLPHSRSMLHHNGRSKSAGHLCTGLQCTPCHAIHREWPLWCILLSVFSAPHVWRTLIQFQQTKDFNMTRQMYIMATFRQYSIPSAYSLTPHHCVNHKRVPMYYCCHHIIYVRKSYVRVR
jgi:hypothetical protein